MPKDWTGNFKSTYMTLGASNHTDKEREENDYYATDPKAIDVLLDECKVGLSDNIWEVSCGERHLSKRLEEKGYKVRSSDLVDRLQDGSIEVKDFLQNEENWNGDIVTNPPYKYAIQFIEKAMESIEDGYKVCMFLKVQFLESSSRKKLFTKYPPKCVYVSSSRILCAKNGDFDYMRAHGGSAVAYAWYVWEKGYRGETILKWVN